MAALPEVEKTLAMIKPDAVRAGKAEEIMQLIELNGFTIVAKQKLQLTRSRAEEFYGEHYGKPFFPRLVEFMTSGPIWALVLAKPDAIKEWRNLMGPTNCFKAREEAPRSLRALYGTDGTQNATHGSDSPASAAREIKFHFPSFVLEPLLDADAAKAYISKHLQPALSKALTELARQKPSADNYGAITFLADYLLNNNPNKPRIITPDEWDPSMEHEDDEAEFAHAQLRAVQARQAADEARAAAEAAAAAAAAELQAAPAAAASEPQAPSQAVVTESAPAPPAAASRPSSVPPSGPAPPSAAPADADEAFLNAAATKVQSSYRGYMARKQVAQMRADAPDSGAADSYAQEPSAPVQQQPEALVLAPSRPPTVVRVQGGISAREQVLTAVFGQLDRDGSGFVDKDEFKAALSAMGHMRGGALADEAAHHMEAMDVNADNRVSLDEFMEHMNWMGGVLDDAEFATFIHDVYNISVEALVDEVTGEVGGVMAVSGFDSREDVLEAAFRALDRDGSGQIDKEEFKAAVERAGQVLGGEVSEEAARHIEAMDANADNKVSMDEFVEHIGWLSGVLSDTEFFEFMRDTFHITTHAHALGVDVPTAPPPEQPSKKSKRPLTVVRVPGGMSQRTAVLTAVFGQLDADGSGFVDKEEFRAALGAASRLHGGALAEELDKHLAAMDANADNRVSLDEFMEEMNWLGGALDDAEFAIFIRDVYNISVESVVDTETGEVTAVAGAGDYTPEQIQAVTKIQAAGRGMLDRKRVAAMKSAQE